jgi:hypothetical protein
MFNIYSLYCLINVLRYFILIKFILKYITCFHNILEAWSCNKIMTCNISINFDTKTLKSKHWLCTPWLLLVWTHFVVVLYKTCIFFSFLAFWKRKFSGVVNPLHIMLLNVVCKVCNFFCRFIIVNCILEER